MSGPTPIPWEADFSESDDFRVRVFGGPRGDIEVCVVYSDEDRDPHATPEERDANALLIAAAPELLAALRVLAAFAATHTGDGATPEEGRLLDGYGEGVAHAVTEARAALAKAGA